jgi:hypothetical protein
LIFLPMLWFTYNVYQYRRRFREGKGCAHCGYDLSGLDEQGNCPECGKPYGTSQPFLSR